MVSLPKDHESRLFLVFTAIISDKECLSYSETHMGRFTIKSKQAEVRMESEWAREMLWWLMAMICSGLFERSQVHREFIYCTFSPVLCLLRGVARRAGSALTSGVRLVPGWYDRTWVGRVPCPARPPLISRLWPANICPLLPYSLSGPC